MSEDVARKRDDDSESTREELFAATEGRADEFVERLQAIVNEARMEGFNFIGGLSWYDQLTGWSNHRPIWSGDPYACAGILAAVEQDLSES